MQIILLQNAQKNEISALLGQKFAIFYIFLYYSFGKSSALAGHGLSIMPIILRIEA